MMAIDYKKILDDLRNAVTAPVTEAANKLLQDNQDAAEFLQDRSKRVAELWVEYIQTGDGSAREAVMLQIQVVRQSIENELSSVAVNASIEARASFANAMRTALAVLIKIIPAIVASV